MTTSHSHADRNLLFGILAVQLEFIDQDALLQAMGAWMLHKSRSLGEILVEQQRLTAGQQALLAALVATHVAHHQQDPQQSLTALSSVASSLCQQLQQVGDAELSLSLTHVVPKRSTDVALASELTETAPFAGASPTGSRFRVLRPHAKGGLGEVFIASDEELHREVALKQIQAAHADHPESRSRFLMEAELTGRLEHPGIVPIYGLGQYGDGRPFYAMRFIRGSSLKEAIQQFHAGGQAQQASHERGLQLRKLLGRFIDVCDAVEYAHSRGVLHRDLKPGNVMLGKHGETLVVDWGLAKIIGQADAAQVAESAVLLATGSGTSPTQMGSAVGTPAYMSPEQAAGRLDLLGTASDVYSLGATLYALLTGSAPVQEDELSIALRKVQQGDIPPPREINSWVPAELNAICLKSMSLDPADRYARPRDLADDIEHWLADEPVTAYREPWRARAARWARRHKTLVTTAAGVLLVALASLTVGALMLTAANRRISAAQQIAEENERKAQENFRLARGAVDDYLTTVSQEILLEEPGMQPLRQQLLTAALGYYQDFLSQHEGDPDLLLELRDANFLVGTVQAEIGDQAEALHAFETALALNQQLVRTQPDSTELRFKLARCYRAWATSLADRGKSTDAIEALDEAIRLLTQVESEQAAPASLLQELREVLNQKGSLKHDQGQLTAAAELYERASEYARRLTLLEDPTGENRNGLARIHHNLASISRAVGDHEPGRAHLNTAIEIRQQLVKEFPHRQRFHSQLALSYSSLANLAADLGDFQQAIELQQETIGIREQLVAHNPAVIEYHDLLAGSYGNLATSYRQIDELDKSVELALQANAIWQRLAEEHPDVVQHRDRLGNSLYNLGNWHLGNPVTDATRLDPAESKTRLNLACEYYAESIQVYEQLVAEHPGIPDFQASLAKAYNNCGTAYSLLEDQQRSQAMNARALAVREQLVREHADVPDYVNQLASTYFNSASEQPTQEETFALLNKSIELRQSLVERFPDVPDYRYKLAFSLQALALRQFLSGEQLSALPTFERLIPILEQLQVEFPQVPNYRRMLTQSLELYAAGQRLSGKWQAAVETELKIAGLFERMLEAEPGNEEFLIGQAAGIEGAGKCYHKAREYPQALDYYQQAIELLQPLVIRDSAKHAAALRNLLELRIDIFETLARYPEQAQDLTTLIALSTETVPLEIRRARARALAGDQATAVAELEESLRLAAALSASDHYNAACAFSLAVAAAGKDQQLASDQLLSQQARLTEQAVQQLRLAQQADFFATSENRAQLATDLDFEPIRKSESFVEFQTQVLDEATTDRP